MKCFQCSKGKMSAIETEMAATVRGECFSVVCTAMVCGRFGFQVLNPEQTEAYSRASADAYRLEHGQLTTAQIRGYRERLGMSQQTFAEYLRAGVASVKRWEAGQIQDEAMDELIRVKCDPDYCTKTMGELAAICGVAGNLRPAKTTTPTRGRR